MQLQWHLLASLTQLLLHLNYSTSRAAPLITGVPPACGGQHSQAQLTTGAVDGGTDPPAGTVMGVLSTAALETQNPDIAGTAAASTSVTPLVGAVLAAAAAGGGSIQKPCDIIDGYTQHSLVVNLSDAATAAEGCPATAPPATAQAGQCPDHAQAQCSAGAPNLTVTDLKPLLQQVCAERSDVKEHIVPVRYLARLLHGQDVDFSTVQLAELLPQVGVLLQYIRDRLEGTVQGKTVLRVEHAVQHAASLLFVLGLPEVRTVLGQQQAQQLVAAVQTAHQEFQAGCASQPAVTAAEKVSGCQPRNMAGPGNSDTTAPTQATAERSTDSDTAEAAAAAATAAARQEQVVGREHGGLSFAQLQAVLEQRAGKLIHTRAA